MGCLPSRVINQQDQVRSLLLIQRLSEEIILLFMVHSASALVQNSVLSTTQHVQRCGLLLPLSYLAEMYDLSPRPLSCSIINSLSSSPFQRTIWQTSRLEYQHFTLPKQVLQRVGEKLYNYYATVHVKHLPHQQAHSKHTASTQKKMTAITTCQFSFIPTSSYFRHTLLSSQQMTYKHLRIPSASCHQEG